MLSDNKDHILIPNQRHVHTVLCAKNVSSSMSAESTTILSDYSQPARYI